MDILTPKGQSSLEQEKMMVKAIAKLWKIEAAFTPKDDWGKVDGVFHKNGMILSVFESKCRDMTMEQLRGPYKNEWLISNDKIQNGRKVAKAMRVPFIGLLLLTFDNTVMVIDIADDVGDLLVKVRNKYSLTQASCNGGEAFRDNAYIKMDNCKIIQL